MWSSARFFRSIVIRDIIATCDCGGRVSRWARKLSKWVRMNALSYWWFTRCIKQDKISGEHPAKSEVDSPMTTYRSSSLGRRIVVSAKSATNESQGDLALTVQIYSVCWAAQQRS